MLTEDLKNIKMLKIVRLIALMVLIGCSSKKVVTEKEYINKTDTIIRVKDRFIIKPVKDTITIEAPCDSLGNLKPFKTVLKTSQGNISIENKDNNIEAKIDLDSIINSIEKEYKNKVEVKEVRKDKVVIRYRINKDVLIMLLISLILNIYFIRQKLRI